MNNIITTDLSEYGFKELSDASELLKAYAEHGSTFLEGGITLNFNKNSGYVFLSDSDYNVGVEEDGKLVQFYTCGECGFEGTQSQAIDEGKNFENNNGFCSLACDRKEKENA